MLWIVVTFLKETKVGMYKIDDLVKWSKPPDWDLRSKFEGPISGHVRNFLTQDW